MSGSNDAAELRIGYRADNRNSKDQQEPIDGPADHRRRSRCQCYFPGKTLRVVVALYTVLLRLWPDR